MLTWSRHDFVARTRHDTVAVGRSGGFQPGIHESQRASFPSTGNVMTRGAMGSRLSRRKSTFPSANFDDGSLLFS